MMRLLKVVAVLVTLSVTLAGCVVAPEPAAVWVPGHYGPYGGWIPGHWR
jgi:hypothetical protein